MTPIMNKYVSYLNLVLSMCEVWVAAITTANICATFLEFLV